jgi:serine protease Do
MLSIYNSIVRIKSNNQDFDYLNPPNIINDVPCIGTGFFISNNIIITCAHIIDTAKVVYFTIPSISNIKYEAKIMGICVNLDLAILGAIKYKSEYYLKLKNSDFIDIEDSIKSIGFPLASAKLKITKGIISGVENELIQIDSAINGGNSGGPLLNKNNEVIGVVSSKIMFASGVGYAIPINLLKIFSNIKSKKIIYNNCNLLTNFSNTSEYRIEMINNLVKSKIKSGITISEISKESILKKNGLEIGDLIIEFDNNKINNYGEIELTNKMKSKIKINYYTNKLLNDIDYNIKYYSQKENKIIEKKIKFDDYNYLGIKKILPLFERLDHIIIGGLIITPLTLNIIDSHNIVISNFNKQNYFNPKVVIVNILPTSPFNKTENIKVGNLIEKINCINIIDFNHLKEVIIRLKSTEKYLTIETNNNKIDTIDINLI